MSCKVEGCPLPENHYNPFIKTFRKFHGNITETFSPLPSEGKIAECAKRIILIAISSFAYLILGIGFVFGLAVDSYWKNKHFQQVVKLKPDASAFPNMDEAALDNLWKKRVMLFSLVKERPAFCNRWKEARISKILAEPKILDQLNVELPLQKIKEIYEKFGIIVLRKPKNEKLLFYCGNGPIYSSAMKTYCDPKKGFFGGIYGIKTHDHGKFDTVDVDILMNPTIVSQSLSPGLKEYIQSISHQYKEVVAEPNEVIHRGDVTRKSGEKRIEDFSLMEKKISILDAICSEKADVINAYSIMTSISKNWEQDVEEITNLAKAYNFQTSTETRKYRNGGPIYIFLSLSRS